MRIVVFSLGPIFPALVHGGSQKTLGAVLRHLGDGGHECTVFCTRRTDNSAPFKLHPLVEVHPVLGFKQTYPEPYYTAVYRLRDVITTLRRALDRADVLYVHDGELLFHFLYEDIPAVIALQDFVYPDTLGGAFGFRRDHLVLPSTYLRACVTAIFADFRKLAPSNVSVVPNGFDLDDLRPTEPEPVRRALRLRGDELLVLHPHRPDPRKGLTEAIATLSLCKSYLPESAMRRVRLAVPIWMDSAIAPGSSHVYQGLYKDAEEQAAALGMPDLLVLHPWLAPDLMPAYYSLGRATLSIGNFIESFGNVAVESELCGTPAIVSRVGAQRDILPDELVSKIPYGRLDQTAEVLAGHLLSPRQQRADVRDYVSRHYSLRQMVEGYANTITTATRTPAALELPVRANSSSDLLLTPPWCEYSQAGYYNDYEYGYCRDSRLLDVLSRHSTPVCVAELLAAGIDDEQLGRWVRDGHLLRTPANEEPPA